LDKIGGRGILSAYRQYHLSRTVYTSGEGDDIWLSRNFIIIVWLEESEAGFIASAFRAYFVRSVMGFIGFAVGLGEGLELACLYKYP
jgi:hypothetical protein